MIDELHQIGDIVSDRYTIVSVLGRGGMAITYAATDRLRDRAVAIKVLSLRQASQWKAIELFEREAKVLASLNHPQIPKYIDYFYTDLESDRRFYLVQELIEGKSLNEIVQNGMRMTEGEVKEIAIQILNLLCYLHELSPPVVHRDIKPHNLIQRPTGAIALVDFGAVQDIYRNTIAGGSTFVGTYGYMAPEQFQGQASGASDLYGLGATLMFLLTHRSPSELPQNRMKIDVRACTKISPEFAEWLEQAIEPTTEDRFPSARIALEILEGKRNSTYSLANNLANNYIATLKSSGEIAKTRKLKPLDTRIQFERTSDRLTFKIPSLGYRPLTWFFGALALGIYWGLDKFILPYLNTFGLLSQIALGFVAVMVGLMSLMCAFLFVYALIGNVLIEMDRQTFRISWHLFGIRIGRERGYNSEITRIGIEEIESENGQKSTQYAIWRGTSKHRFDSILIEKEETDWILGELLDFLSHL
ncbi:serine/threonine-protein kinase [Pseudanabaena sp. 'Roaring Creek']|uniref:serine/threonine protein kinase n=1 Tax=Pseudanabaena sp. 'Roaring Creek' TaxID=1681830 RepID=UPI0006D7A813|nr:serine/threonine-protein kinase [Pseudanabaena sp. 'Roaring Creek']